MIPISICLFWYFNYFFWQNLHEAIILFKSSVVKFAKLSKYFLKYILNNICSSQLQKLASIVFSCQGQLFSWTYLKHSRCPYLAALYYVKLSHRHQFSWWYFKQSKFPFFAEFEHVLLYNRHPSNWRYCRFDKFPPKASDTKLLLNL